MCHGRHERADESRNDFIEEVTLDAITVVYQGQGAELLEMDIAAQGGEDMVEDRRLGSYLEPLDIADLLDRAVMTLIAFPWRVVGCRIIGWPREGVVGVGPPPAGKPRNGVAGLSTTSRTASPRPNPPAAKPSTPLRECPTAPPAPTCPVSMETSRLLSTPEQEPHPAGFSPS